MTDRLRQIACDHAENRTTRNGCDQMIRVENSKVTWEHRRMYSDIEYDQMILKTCRKKIVPVSCFGCFCPSPTLIRYFALIWFVATIAFELSIDKGRVNPAHVVIVPLLLVGLGIATVQMERENTWRKQQYHRSWKAIEKAYLASILNSGPIDERNEPTVCEDSEESEDSQESEESQERKQSAVSKKNCE